MLNKNIQLPYEVAFLKNWVVIHFSLMYACWQEPFIDHFLHVVDKAFNTSIETYCLSIF